MGTIGNLRFKRRARGRLRPAESGSSDHPVLCFAAALRRWPAGQCVGEVASVAALGVAVLLAPLYQFTASSCWQATGQESLQDRIAVPELSIRPVRAPAQSAACGPP